MTRDIEGFEVCVAGRRIMLPYQAVVKAAAELAGLEHGGVDPEMLAAAVAKIMTAMTLAAEDDEVPF